MSHTSAQPQTFSHLYNSLLHKVRQQTGVTATEAVAKSYINTALFDLHLGTSYKFPWAEREAILRTQAQYTTGTVTITRGSTTLTGASTAWNTANAFAVNNTRAGGKIVVGGSTDVYEVSSVASDTSITLTQRFIATSVSAGTYRYYEDEYDLHADFLRPYDFNYFDQNRQITLVNRREFRMRFIRNSTPGKLRDATIVDRSFSGSTTPRRRILFHPPPSDVNLVKYSFITNKLAVSSAGTEQTQMTADTDEPIVPLYARHALVFHALYHWYRDLKNDARSQEAKDEYTSIMLRLTADMEVGAPRPQIRPRMGIYTSAAKRPYSGSSGSRYTLGTGFDELRDKG